MSKQAVYLQSGDVIDYTAAANIAVGDVVPLGSRVGVAVTDIANGATGAVSIDGVYEMPAVNNAAFSVGDVVFWDDSANKLTLTGAGNTVAGIVVAAKAETGTTAKVDIEVPAVQQQAVIAVISTADASDDTTCQALANDTKDKVNGIIAALKAAGIVANS